METFTLSVKECRCDNCKRKTKEPSYFKVKDTWLIWFFCSNDCGRKFTGYWSSREHNPMLTMQ